MIAHATGGAARAMSHPIVLVGFASLLIAVLPRQGLGQAGLPLAPRATATCVPETLAQYVRRLDTGESLMLDATSASASADGFLVLGRSWTTPLVEVPYEEITTFPRDSSFIGLIIGREGALAPVPRPEGVGTIIEPRGLPDTLGGWHIIFGELITLDTSASRGPLRVWYGYYSRDGWSDLTALGEHHDLESSSRFSTHMGSSLRVWRDTVLIAFAGARRNTLQHDLVLYRFAGRAVIVDTLNYPSWVQYVDVLPTPSGLVAVFTALDADERLPMGGRSSASILSSRLSQDGWTRPRVVRRGSATVRLYRPRLLNAGSGVSLAWIERNEETPGSAGSLRMSYSPDGLTWPTESVVVVPGAGNFSMSADPAAPVGVATSLNRERESGEATVFTIDGPRAVVMFAFDYVGVGPPIALIDDGVVHLFRMLYQGPNRMPPFVHNVVEVKCMGS